MPRYEKDERFWEIEREGRQIRIRYGRVGDPSEQKVHNAHFENEAMVEYDRRIEAKLADGYRPIEQPREELLALEPELERAVIEALDPAALQTDAGVEALRSAWTVLGDWLSARGDVRGELIAIDETRSYVDGPGSRRLLAQRDRLLQQWIPRWFGDFGKLDGRGPISLVWDHGFIAAARIGTKPHGLDLTRWPMGLRDLVPVLEAVLSSPLALTVRQLRIAELDPHSRRDLARALPLLRLQLHPTLLRLELGGVALGRWVRDQTGNLIQRLALARIGSLAPLALAEMWAPRLAALRIVGRELRVFPPLPQLRALELHVPVIDEELRRWVAAGDWPKLERLWIRATNLKDPWASGEGPGFSRVLELLDRSELRELGIQGSAALDQVLWRAVSAPLELDELRLFECSRAEVETLIAAADHFGGIGRIVIEDAELGPRWDALERAYGDRLVRCKTNFGLIGEGDGDDVFESLYDIPGF